MPVQATNYDESKNYNIAEMSDLTPLQEEINEIKSSGVQVADTLAIGSMVMWDDSKELPSNWEYVDDVDSDGICNENLLINSDFASGIINQKGQSVYTSPNEAKFNLTVDGWLAGQYGKVSVFNGYLRFESVSGSPYFKQKFYGKYIGKTLTVAVKIKNKELIVKTVTISDSQTAYVVNDSDKEIRLSGASDGVNFVMFFKKGGVVLDVEYFKVELGSNFTGMPVWNYFKELEKCFVYFDSYFDFRLPQTEKNGLPGWKSFTFSLPRIHTMKNKPTASYKGTLNSQDGFKLRNMLNVTDIQIKEISLEVQSMSVVIRCSVDDSVNVDTTDAQLYVGHNGFIFLDGYEY